MVDKGVWAAVSADKGIFGSWCGLAKGGTETPQWTNDAVKSLASDGAAAGARNPDEMMVTVAWTWASRRSNGHSVTQKIVQEGRRGTMITIKNAVVTEARIHGNIKIWEGGVLYTFLTRGGRARGLLEKQRTTSKYFSIGSQEPEEAHYEMMGASENGRGLRKMCVAMWSEWKGGEQERQRQKLWALP
ncbi:hypothetical protein FPOAC1_008696 [Fusarium poae]|jgi:hypothetical protein|uniref:hypothetical protein n=1 Tax=Fusarium poae TaxID=36050 RepID=UPI001CEB067B|nr:hypothetical protein FPOAC1_008696 [Fusarium poae]KAG8669305.1 hypothetical protein FPOAC1_008696 [Fusarium poae]